MRPKLLFLLFLNFVFISTSYSQNIIPIVKERPADFEYLSAPDSLGIRHQIKMPKTINTNKSSQVSEAKIPYPIIFIHGLNSSSETWDSTTGFMDTNYSFTYGGRFDINLNFDGDKNNANKNIYPVSGADIAFYSIPTVSNADYYYVNFDVGIDGSFKPNPSSAMYNLSNQSAIAKQGKALQYVVNKVMQLTGKDKVILMGHSMGGLAAREYIQNQDNWQNDNQHHVAKLVTTGTPHGGSNASASFLGTILIGIDNKSEAVRDLRTSYFYSPNAPGVFLFGGVESNSVMNDMLLSNFYNLDVNCNAIIGDNVIGLNRKNLFSTIDYSCIIGTLLGSSDGVVNTTSADLNTYYQNITRNVFKVSTSHSSLPDQNYQNMQGLDEPNNYDTAYGIGFNKIYYGFVTEQSLNSPSNVDYDDYTFTLTSGGQVNINIGVPLSVNLNARIVDVNGTIIGSNFSSNGTNIISFSKNLNAGKYYLEIYGLPLRLGTYPAGASAEDKRTLLRAVTEIGHNAAGIIPTGMIIDFKEAAKGVSAPFLDQARYQDEMVAKVILGQTLTSGEGKNGTQALGTVHADVRNMIRDADAAAVAATITRDMLWPFVQFNVLGVDPRRMPRVHIDTKDPRDLSSFVDGLTKYVSLGGKVAASWAAQEAGVPEPAEGEALLSMAAPAQPAAAANDIKTKARAQLSALVALAAQANAQVPGTMSNEPDDVDALVAEMMDEWAPAMGGLVQPLLDRKSVV